ncbi:MAG TPA: DUF6516 family protein [Gaiellaceae bacterium]|nr:DUF6516 family protein [Gaiellaceae bacterium]
MRRRRPPQSLEDYGFERTNQFHHFGAIVESPAAIYLGDWRVIVQCLLIFGQQQQAQLWIYEVVGIENDRATRTKYSYHLTYDGSFVFRYDRDQQHPDMVEHKHLPPDERRVPWDAVTLQEVVDEVVAFTAEREAEAVERHDGEE